MVKVGYALAALATGIIASAGAIYIYEASQTKPCTSNTDCPTGQVCQNGTCVTPPPPTGCTTNLDCPPGQTCDNGTCVQCTPQSCPCNQVWDSVNCVCSDLIPYNLIAPFVITDGAYFYIQYQCALGGASFVYGTASQPAPCQLSDVMGPPSPIWISEPFVVTVVDSAGHPICNQAVTLSLSAMTLPFKTKDGNFVGTITFSLTYGNNYVSDNNGNVAVYISAQINPDIQTSAINIENCLTCCFRLPGSPCPTTTFNQTTNMTIGYTLVGNPNIRGATTVQYNVNVCGAYC